jgi:hypothetical protein
MMSVRNFALIAISDPVGSWLYSRYHYGIKDLVWLNAGTTAAVLLFVPLMPRALMASREGDQSTFNEVAAQSPDDEDPPA